MTGTEGASLWGVLVAPVLMIIGMMLIPWVPWLASEDVPFLYTLYFDEILSFALVPLAIAVGGVTLVDRSVGRLHRIIVALVVLAYVARMAERIRQAVSA